MRRGGETRRDERRGEERGEERRARGSVLSVLLAGGRCAPRLPRGGRPSLESARARGLLSRRESHFNPRHIITAARKVSTQAHLSGNKTPSRAYDNVLLQREYWSYFSLELFSPAEYRVANEEPNVMQLCGQPW